MKLFKFFTNYFLQLIVNFMILYNCRDVSANKLEDNFTIALSDVGQLRELKVNKNHLTQVPDLVFVKNITHLTL